MARVRLSQLDNWNVVDQGQEIRGLRLVDEAGQALGLITDMIVDTDAGYVDAVVLDSGREVSADDIELGGNIVYLRPSSAAQGSAATPMEAPPRRTAVQRVDALHVPVVEESVQVGKRQVEGGGVRVRTEVEEVPVTEQVAVHHEEIDVQRRPAHTPLHQAAPDAFREGTFEVRAYAEEVAIGKQLFVVEEIHINKQLVEHTETVQETVRRTRVDIEEFPDRNPAADSGRTNMT